MSGDIDFDALHDWRTKLRATRDVMLAPLIDNSGFPAGMSEQTIATISILGDFASKAINQINQDMAMTRKPKAN